MAISVNGTRLLASSGSPGANGLFFVQFSAAPTAGSAVIVSIGTPTGSDVVLDVRDTQGNQYTRLLTATVGSLRAYVYICAGVRGLTTSDFLQIACTTGSLLAVAADEASGLGSVTLPDKSASATTGSSSATYAAGPTATTAFANELVWEVIVTPQYNVTQTITPSDSCTVQGTKITTTTCALHTAYRIVSATAAQSASGAFNTNNASAYIALLVTLPDPQSPANTRRAVSSAGANVSAVAGTGARGASFVGAEVANNYTGSRGVSFAGVEVAGVITAPPPTTTRRRPPIILA